jgi:hypothetical protein
MQALLRLSSADCSSSSSSSSCGGTDGDGKMQLAVDSYRVLPLAVRARIENWHVDRAELVLGARLGRATRRATYKWTDVACKVGARVREHVISNLLENYGKIHSRRDLFVLEYIHTCMYSSTYIHAYTHTHVYITYE